ncbi:MAG: DUF2339 domain-containing protein [Chloroflexota bacterium]|nr:DUF2339 domain-containing protein [Chloroflexota bacterium]
MKCSSCGGEIVDTANFCRHCGAAQVSSPAEAAVEGESETEAVSEELDSTEELRAAIITLQNQVGLLSSRIAALESSTAGPESQQPQRPAQAPAPPPQPAQPQSQVAPQAATADVGSGVPPNYYSSGPSTWNWEWLVGGNWLARIGIVAVIIGIGFFLKLAFDNDWIGETGRVVLGLVVGLALLGAGEYWQRKYPVWSQPVTGGGIAVLYLSIFAAFSLYQLIPAWSALAFSLLVTLTAAGLAVRYEARSIAILGILGGFATPLFLADELPQQEALLGYVLALDVGVLALATFRNWRWFTLLALVGSLVLFLFWQEELDPAVWLAQGGITIIFLIFVAATTLFHLIWRRPPRAFDQVLIVVNAASYLGISYWLLWDDFRVWMGGFTLLLALFYGLLAYGILMRHREQANLSMFAVGVALVLLSIAVPVQLDGQWIGPAWAVEGTVLVWLSFFIRMPQLRGFAVAAFAVAGGWLFIDDFIWSIEHYFFEPWSDEVTPLLNARFLSYLIMVAAAYVAAFLWWRNRDDLAYEAERFAPGVFAVAANLVTLWALSVQVVEGVYFLVDGARPFYELDNVISLSLSALWTVYAAVLIAAGIIRQERWLRVGGLALLAVPVAKLFLYDSFQLDQGYRVAAFIGLGALLLAGGFLYQRYSRVIRGFLLD